MGMFTKENDSIWGLLVTVRVDPIWIKGALSELVGGRLTKQNRHDKRKEGLERSEIIYSSRIFDLR